MSSLLTPRINVCGAKLSRHLANRAPTNGLPTADSGQLSGISDPFCPSTYGPDMGPLDLQAPTRGSTAENRPTNTHENRHAPNCLGIDLWKSSTPLRVELCVVARFVYKNCMKKNLGWSCGSKPECSTFHAPPSSPSPSFYCAPPSFVLLRRNSRAQGAA